jgi:SAM-dependent methyltransferase
LRIVTVIDTRDDADIVRRAVAHALGLSDLVLVRSAGTGDDTRSLLAGLLRQGLPLVVFDAPAWPEAGEPGDGDFWRNVRRHFDPDIVVRLRRREFVVTASRDVLERAVTPEESSRARPMPRHPSPMSAQTPGTPTWVAGRLLSRRDLEALDGVAPGGHGAQVPDDAIEGVAIAVAGRSGMPAVPEPTGGGVRGDAPWSVRSPAPEDLAQAIGRPAAHAPGDSRAASADTPGVWAPARHVAELYVDCPPFQYVAERYSPRSVLDIGCGLGAYLRLFRALGAHELRGVDGFADTGEVLEPAGYTQHDLRRPLGLGVTFDLVICAEVIEHVDAAYETTLLESIRRHARDLILFSAAHPGQPGRGHVNCRPVEHWLEYWRAAGWDVDLVDTIAARSLASYLWFRRNLLVLRPAGRHRPGLLDRRDLDSREADVRWFAQRPAVHVRPFEEPLAPIERL